MRTTLGEEWTILSVAESLAPGAFTRKTYFGSKGGKSAASWWYHASFADGTAAWCSHEYLLRCPNGETFLAALPDPKTAATDVTSNDTMVPQPEATSDDTSGVIIGSHGKGDDMMFLHVPEGELAVRATWKSRDEISSMNGGISSLQAYEVCAFFVLLICKVIH